MMISESFLNSSRTRHQMIISNLLCFERLYLEFETLNNFTDINLILHSVFLCNYLNRQGITLKLLLEIESMGTHIHIHAHVHTHVHIHIHVHVRIEGSILIDNDVLISVVIGPSKVCV